jgi:PTS system galactitol-specific IIA component
MGTDGTTILNVQIVFLLAIKEKEKQVEMIQQLMTLIQSPNLLEALLQAGNSSTAMALIQKALA